MSDRRAIVVLILICLALYGRGAGFGFVRADDTDLIEGNAEFLSRLSNVPSAFARSFFESRSVVTDLKTYYRPLAVVSFVIDTAIGGSNPAIYHLTNVVLHALVVVLLFLVLREFRFGITGNVRLASAAQPFRAAVSGAGRPAKGLRDDHQREQALDSRLTAQALGVSLLFAVHPANVQAICWVMGRNELLLAVFSLTALGSFLYLGGASGVGRSFSFVPAGVGATEAHASSHRDPAARRDRAALAIHLLAFAGAVFSKESGVVLLPLLVLWTLLWKSGAANHSPVAQAFWTAEALAKAVRPAGAGTPKGLRYGHSSLALLFSLDIGVAALWWFLRRAALAGAASAPAVESGFSRTRPVVANVAQLFSYLEKTVFPFRLNTMPGVDRTSVALGAIAAIVLVAALGRAVGIRRFTFIAAWFLAFLLPALLVPGLPAYEHRLYVPMIGLALAFGSWDQESGIGDRESRPFRTRARRLTPEAQSRLAALTVAAVFFAISYRYSETFRTPLSYWGRATEGSLYAPVAHVNVGQILQEMDKPEEAASHFRRALELDPNVPKAHNNLGVALMQLGRPREALAAFKTELALHPSNADAHYNLGLYYRREGKEAEAISQWEETLRLNTYYLPAYEKLVEAHAVRGERERSAWYARRLHELQGR